MFSDNSCTTEGTVIRINPLILHGKNLRRAIHFNLLKPPWSFILWRIWFVLFSPMVFFFFPLISYIYSSCLKYIISGWERSKGNGEQMRVPPDARRQLAQPPRSSALLASPADPHLCPAKHNVPATWSAEVPPPSVAAGHSPKVKCREDAFVFKGEASLLLNLLLCLCHGPPVLGQRVHLLQRRPLVLTERGHQQLVPGSITILHG